MERLEQVSAVQRMQDYIEAHIAQPITLLDLAKTAGYSPFHCARVFRELTGKPPFEYIRSLRLTHAALKLRDEKAKVMDVALDFVFDSHEGFTRAFSKAFGVTPNQYRKDPKPIRMFMPYPISVQYKNYLRGEMSMEKKPTGSTVFVQVIERPERKLIHRKGKKAKDYFAFCDGEGCDIWEVLCGIKEALYEPIGMWWQDGLYGQGVEVPLDYAGTVPEGLEVTTLPPCKMMVFQGQPFEDEAFGEAIDDLQAVMKTYIPEIYGFKWADKDAPRFQMEPQGYRGYIEARPVRAIR